MSLRTSLSRSFLLLSIVCLGMTVSSATAQENSLGLFESHSDLGDPQLTGAVLYNSVGDVYRISGAGANMWADRDECHFL